MQHHYIRHDQAPNLLLLFAGWGMDHHPFADCLLPDHDTLCLYDYTTLELDPTLLTGYQSITLVAWSMGVWAASHCFAQTSLPFTRTIAINGTEFPVDNLRGIPHAIFDRTLNTLSEASLAKFNLRMCGGNRELLGSFEACKPHRTLDSLRRELAAIGERAQSSTHTPFIWSSIVVGSNDLIFPSANQQNAWGNHPHLAQLPIAHYTPLLPLIESL